MIFLNDERSWMHGGRVMNVFQFRQVDVFTGQPLRGNPLAIAGDLAAPFELTLVAKVDFA